MTSVSGITLLLAALGCAGCSERCEYTVIKTETGCTIRGDLILRSGGSVNLKGAYRCGEQFERCGERKTCECVP